tara:strand:+ start:78400 stop:78561 length:162 start_codon:yes stop_codon:yes gene_type:complete
MHNKPKYSAHQIKALHKDRERRAESTAMDQLSTLVRQHAASHDFVRDWFARSA